MSMNVCYDWEFLDRGGEGIVPISLGMVNYERDAELYIINSSFPEELWSDWLTENVKPHLRAIHPKNSRIIEVPEHEIADNIYAWLEGFDQPKPWRLVGNYADYDHVCLAQRFGAMIKLPKPMPFFSYDIHQWFQDLGNPRAPIEEELEHNALADARHNVALIKWLKANYEHPGLSYF